MEQITRDQDEVDLMIDRVPNHFEVRPGEIVRTALRARTARVQDGCRRHG